MNPSAQLFATSVDDLQSSLRCELANIKPEDIEGAIRYYGSALNSHPDGGKTKRQVIERHIRALEKLRRPAPTAGTQAPSEDATPFDPDLYTLLNFPPATGKFKDALQDALLEVVTEAFDAAFQAGQKTRFNALRAELKRRYDESGMDSHDLPTWEQMKKQEEDRKIKDGIDAKVAERAGAGNVQAMAYCRQNGIQFSRSESHNAVAEKDCGGPSKPVEAQAPGDGAAVVGAGTNLAELPEEDHDQVLGLQLDMQWEAAIKGEAAQHVFGAMMILLHDHLANLSTRGQVPAGGKGAKGKGLEGWLKKYAPKVKRPTALRWMKATQGLMKKAKIAGPEALQRLLLCDAEELQPAEVATQLELFTLIEGCSQNDLLTPQPEKLAKGKHKKLTAAEATKLLHGVTVSTAENLGFVHKKKAFVVLNEAELDGWIDHLRENLKDAEAWKKMSKTDRAEALAERVKETIREEKK